MVKIFNSKNVSMKVIAGAFLALTGCCESASCLQKTASKAYLEFKDMQDAMSTSKSELVKALNRLDTERPLDLIDSLGAHH